MNTDLIAMGRDPSVRLTYDLAIPTAWKRVRQSRYSAHLPPTPHDSVNAKQINNRATGCTTPTPRLILVCIDTTATKEQREPQVRKYTTYSYRVSHKQHRLTVPKRNGNRRCRGLVRYHATPGLVENHVDVDVPSQQPPLSKLGTVAFERRSERVHRRGQRGTRNTDGVYPVFARLLQLTVCVELFAHESNASDYGEVISREESCQPMNNVFFAALTINKAFRKKSSALVSASATYANVRQIMICLA